MKRAVSPTMLIMCAALTAAPAMAQTPAAKQNAPKPAKSGDLIPRSVLFGNPDKLSPQISPDGNWICFIAPVSGVLNVWVAPADKIGEARPITKDTGRRARIYDLTTAGKKQLAAEESRWQAVTSAVNRVLRLA